MSRLLFAAIPSPGHVNPMLTVAEALREKGYDIIFHTGEVFRDRVEAVGLSFIPFPEEADFDHRDLLRAEPSLKNMPSNERGLFLFANLLGGRIPFLEPTLNRIIEQEKIDAVLYDVFYMGVLPALLRSQPRPAIVGCGVVAPMWLDQGCSLTTGFSRAPGWRERNIAENKKIEERRGVAWRHIDSVLTDLGVVIPGGFHDNQLYQLPDLFLQFGAEAFEFPREEQHGNVVFVGPLLPERRASRSIATRFKTRDASRPLVFVSQGTVANRDLEQLVYPTIEGLAEEDIDVLATTGGAHAGRSVSTSNAHVESYMPYEDVLPETAVFVTNGGYNGVQQALSCGVPVVVAGLTEDKPRVGHRVEWSGVGINLKTATPTKEQVRDAVREILRNPSYREYARAIQALITKADTIGMIMNRIDAAIVSAQRRS